MDAAHRGLVRLGAELTEEIAALPLVGVGFVALRRRVREFPAGHATATEIDRLVRSLVSV